MYGLLDRILEGALYYVMLFGNHFGWPEGLRDVGNSILRWLNG